MVALFLGHESVSWLFKGRVQWAILPWCHMVVVLVGRAVLAVYEGGGKNRLSGIISYAPLWHSVPITERGYKAGYRMFSKLCLLQL